jgi:hypothetical protein
VINAVIKGSRRKRGIGHRTPTQRTASPSAERDQVPRLPDPFHLVLATQSTNDRPFDAGSLPASAGAALNAAGLCGRTAML